MPNQNPVEIERLFRQHIQRLAPRTVRVAIRSQIRSFPALIDRKHPGIRAAFAAYRRVFGCDPKWLRSGGSIPVVADLWQQFRIPTVLLGFASPEDGMHGPNEKFLIKNFRRGILTVMAFLDELGKPPPAGGAACGPNGKYSLEGQNDH